MSDFWKFARPKLSIFDLFEVNHELSNEGLKVTNYSPNRALFFKKSNIAQLTEKQLNQAPFGTGSKYTRLTNEKRHTMGTLLRKGEKPVGIARDLGGHRSTKKKIRTKLNEESLFLM